MPTALPPSLHNVLSHDSLRWVFVGGKGGVGKTTVSSSLALALASARASVLLISTDPAHNLSDAFATKIGSSPTPIPGVPNLSAMEIDIDSVDVSGLDPDAPGGAPDPRAAMDAMDAPPEVRAMVEEMFGAAGGAAGGGLGRLAKMVPGADEAVAFGALMQSVQKMRHDVVVFDTAPTGHTVRMLGFPALMEKMLAKVMELQERFAGVMAPMAAAMGAPDLMAGMAAKVTELRDVVRSVVEQFRNREWTTFVCVCIPEFLSVYETERLLQDLGKYGIHSNNIVINQVIDLPDTETEEGLALVDGLYQARVNLQRKYLEQIDELYADDFNITKVPILRKEVRGADDIREFSKLLTAKSVVDFGSTVDYSFDPSLMNVVEQTSLKWIFCGGKGGVGKTTTSSALAVALCEHASRSSHKVLLISTDPAHNLSDAFNQKISPGAAPTKLDGFANLYAMEVEPAESAEELLGEYLPESVLPRGVFRDLASSIPGIDEAVSFAQIAKLIEAMDFKTVVFDTAPTGHTLKLLHFPELLDEGLQRLGGLRDQYGPMLSMLFPSDPSGQGMSFESVMRKLDDLKKTVEKVSLQLKNIEETTFVCVAIAEFLSVYETERLVQELVGLEIDVRNIVCNQLLPPNEKDKLGLLKSRVAMQQKYLAQVRELYPPEEFHLTTSNLLKNEVRGVDVLREFISRLT